MIMTDDETEIISCKCRYTPEELRELAERMATKMREMEMLEDEKKDAVNRYKERIENAQFAVKNAARRYREGFEMRNVECLVVRNYDTGTITYTRKDNGETALVRPMTEDEKQMRLQDAIDSVTLKSGDREVTLKHRKQA